jgi:hypothetical protein
MADPPSTSDGKAAVSSVEAKMEDDLTKMDREKSTEFPEANEKSAEKPVEAPAPIKPAGAMTSFVEATKASSSAAKEDSKDALATNPDTGAPIAASRAAVVPKTTAATTPSTSERSKAVVGMPAPAVTSSSAPGTAKMSTTPATVAPASASNDAATTLVVIAPAPQPETPTATTTKPTIVAPQLASTKKRKAPSVNSTPMPVTGTTTAGPKPSSTLITSRPPVSSPSMADYPVVAQTVKDIFTLLETCTYQTTIHTYIPYIQY